MMIEFTIIDKIEGKVNLIIDSNKVGKQTSEARRIFEKLTIHEKYNKIAIQGRHPVAREIATIVMAVSKKKDMGFFKTREEALSWFKE